jgi:hypothetical protein
MRDEWIARLEQLAAQAEQRVREFGEEPHMHQQWAEEAAELRAIAAYLSSAAPSPSAATAAHSGD